MSCPHRHRRCLAAFLLASAGCYPQIDLSGIGKDDGSEDAGGGVGGQDTGSASGRGGEGDGGDGSPEMCVVHDDIDGDGFGDPDTRREVPCEDLDADAVLDDSDCDDTRADVHPGIEERCDAIDNDCDGSIDEDDAIDAASWYADVDGDGFGNDDDQVRACAAPTAYVGVGGDCDDFDPDVRPGAREVCDGWDNDCDGAVDDDDADVDLTSAPTWWLDSDGDGYGTEPGVVSCSASSAWVLVDGDCEDGDAAIHPGASEVCNGQDDDCNSLIDDDDPGLDTASATTWYVDADGDGHGDATSGGQDCVVPSGAVTDGTDCDDGDDEVSPSATEVCNGWDDDCDSLVDDDDSSLDLSTRTTWFTDADGDGFGDASSSVVQCAEPSGSTTDDTDCDDSDATVNPGATEICSDGIDNDCSGTVDDAACIEVDITTDGSAVDLHALAGSPTGATSVYVTIASGVTISSPSTGSPAMTTSGFDSGSLIIIENLGTIHGHGGDGACDYGGNGETGGDAIEVTVDVELDTSSGGVYGGGGGGGAGDDPSGGGGGAGGGYGCDGGGHASGGVGGHGSQRFSSVPGGDGSLYDGSLGLGGAWGTSPSGGTGGSGGSPGDGSCEKGQGGAGGGWGGGGGGGAACGSSRNPGNGGDAGWAIRVLSGSITITGGNDTTHIKGWVG